MNYEEKLRELQHELARIETNAQPSTRRELQRVAISLRDIIGHMVAQRITRESREELARTAASALTRSNEVVIW